MARQKAGRCARLIYIYIYISTALARTVPILQVNLLHPMGPVLEEVQLIIRTEKPDSLRKTCRDWSIPECTMCSYNETRRALIVAVILTPDKRPVRRLKCLPQRARTSTVTAAPAFNPSPNRCITILLKPTIIYQWLVAHNTQCFEAVGTQLMALFEYRILDKAMQTVA